jgi:glutathione synthase/RimK-type ligase-like ATP-grasp enzyme
VFHESSADASYRSLAWFEVIQGWLATRPEVRILNREYIGKRTNKLYVLHLAQNVGLQIPTTLISNNIRHLEARHMASGSVVKPVTGGGYCKSIEEVISETELHEGIAATPAIVQRKLTGPDVRIYAIDNTFIAFSIHADKIDYRESHNRTIELMDQPSEYITQPLKRLMAVMGLDWCAADFKTDQETGQLIFLEINSNPMFAVFDKVAQRRITKAIAGFLAH